MAAAPVAADQDLAAAAAAGRIDVRVGDLDVLAAHHDRAAGGAALLARRRHRAGELDGLRRRARRLAAAGGGVEHDHAVVAADRVGADDAPGVDDGIDHGARRRGGELDPSAVRAQRAVLGVADQRLERPAGGDVDDLVDAMLSPTASVISLSPYMSSVKLLPDASATVPSVAVMVPELRTPGATSAAKPPLVAVIVPLIDDRGIRPARNVEIVPPGHEVGVLDVIGGGEKARRVHHAAGAEQDAVAVDDEDPAVGGQRAHDLRRAEAAGHAVERDRRAARLIEAHALVGADVERVPVDDRAAARLVDDHRRAALALDGGGAADHRPAFGTGRGLRQAERQQRRGREQQIAQAWMHRGVLLQPSGEDEEESRVLARACLQQFGHGPGAEQALALRDLRNRQISGNRVQPSQP